MDPEITDLLTRVAELTDEELADLEARLVAMLDETSETVTDESLASMEAIAAGIESIRTTVTERTEAAEARAARAAEILARVRPTEVPPDPAAGDEEPEEEEEEEEEPAAAPEAAVPPDPVPVAAAATTPPITPTRVVPRAPATRRPVASRPRMTITAAADIPGRPAGGQFRNMREVAEAITQRKNAFRGQHSGPEEFVRVASIAQEWPEERTLGGDPLTNLNRINAATTPEALVASGGLCAPLEVLYSLSNVAVDDRPVTSCLTPFRAERGGIRFIRPPQLASFAGGVGAHTVANDVAGATKACLTVTCPAETTVQTEAITFCLRFGNMGARAFPEQVEDAVAKTHAFHSRFAERRLLTAIGTGSTNVTSGQTLGTVRDVLATMDRAADSYRNRHRMGLNATLNVILPGWLISQMQADLARELPGRPTDPLATTRAQIENFFAVRNIDVCWALDGETGQDFASQGGGGGPLIGWPSTAIGYLFHPGAWLFLDGGTLDLGIVRDSTLNSTNDYQIWMETFEAVAFVGLESLRITMDLCPSGEVSGTADITPLVCASGS
jgi:hypothetical protein